MDCEREINVYNYVTGAPKVAETLAWYPAAHVARVCKGSEWWTF